MESTDGIQAPPAVAAIVVNYWSTERLPKTVELLRRFLPPLSDIIIVDNSADDGGDDMKADLAKRGVTVITCMTNLGFARAANLGAWRTPAEHLLLVNPDVVGIRGRIEDLLAPFEVRDVVATAPRLVGASGALEYNCWREPSAMALIGEAWRIGRRLPWLQLARRFRMLDWDHRAQRVVDVASGAVLMLRSSDFRELGGFDERFFVYWEDTDLLVRAKRLGKKTVFVPNVEATHLWRQSSASTDTDYSALMLDSQLKYASKHLSGLGVFALRTALLAREVIRWLVASTGVPRSEHVSRIRLIVGRPRKLIRRMD